MMKTESLIIIIILLVIIFFLRECTPEPQCPECPPPTECDTIKGDSVPYPVIKYRPKIIYQDTGSTRWKYKNIDTAAILKDYFARYYYADTLVNDTNLFIAIYDTISENKIIWRNPSIYYYPTIIKQTKFIPAVPVRKIYGGIGLGRNPDQFGLASSLLYISKKDNAYSANYDILNKDFYLFYHWKISLKKH